VTIKIRPATQEDATKFYNGNAPHSFRGVVIAKDDDIIALGGVFRDNNLNMAFSEFKPEAFKHKKAIVKATNMAVEIMKENYNLVFVYVFHNQYGTSHSYIKHYGFTEYQPNIYVWRR